MRHSQKQTSESEYDGFPIQRAEPSDRSPRGLRPVGDAVHREGMGFVVWFEPERVWRGTYIAQDGMISAFRRQMQRYIQQKAAVETDSTLRQSGSDGPNFRPEWLSCHGVRQS